MAAFILPLATAPVIPVILPLFAAAILAGLTKAIPQRWSQLIALGTTLVTLADALYLLRTSASQPIVYWLGNWRPRQGIALGVSFVVDPIGSGLAAFAAFLTLAALVFSSKYFDTVGNHFHALLLAFLGAMCGFSLTGDMFNMFVFFELMSAAAFALCGYKTDDPGSLQGAFNFAVTNTIAAYFVLSGIGLLYARTGALNMAQMGRALASGRLDSLVLVGFVFIVCGYLVKAAIVPFHFWLADAHAVAPTPVCILFSGVMVEMGLFALARIYWATFDHALHLHLRGLTTLFVSVGVLTAIIGASMCFIQRNLKRLLAFSTVSHIGLMMIGIGLFAPAGLAGAAVYTLGHGMVKGALFIIAGILLHRFKAVDERQLRARGRGLWWTAGVFFLAGMALAGFPGSGLAIGDDLIDFCAKAAGLDWTRWAFVFAEAVTAAAVFRAGGRVFFRWGSAEKEGDLPEQEEKPETKQGHEHTPASMFVPGVVLLASGLLLGFVPSLKSVTLSSAVKFVNTDAYAAHVLDAQPLPQILRAQNVPSHPFERLLPAAVAIVIAAIALFGPRGYISAVCFAKPVHVLHRLHSGHIGDYIAFLTFGLATFGLICAYCFR